MDISDRSIAQAFREAGHGAYEGVRELYAAVLSRASEIDATPPAGARDAVDWAEDAREWGNALNEAAWKFTEVCPEKSALLFNHCKPALREAILLYAEKAQATQPAASGVGEELYAPLPPEGQGLAWIRRAYNGEGPYTIWNMDVAYAAGWQAALAAQPAPGVGGVSELLEQLRSELAADKGWDYTEYEKGRLAEKERVISQLAALSTRPAESVAQGGMGGPPAAVQTELDRINKRFDHRAHAFSVPDSLHPETEALIGRFAYALAVKLAAAQEKYGYADGWREPDWMDECRVKLAEHVAKGDPRDVAAYCAFLWHHGASTSPTPATGSGGEAVSIEDDIMFGWRLASSSVCEKDARIAARRVARERSTTAGEHEEAEELIGRLEAKLGYYIERVKSFPELSGAVEEAIRERLEAIKAAHPAPAGGDAGDGE